MGSRLVTVAARERYGSDERTEGKPWEIAWGELRWKGTDGSDDWVDEEETVGNSSGELRGEGARWKRRQGWTEGKPWEIAWGLGRAPLDGKEIVGNSMGRASVRRSDTGVTTRWTEGKQWASGRY